MAYDRHRDDFRYGCDLFHVHEEISYEKSLFHVVFKYCLLLMEKSNRYVWFYGLKYKSYYKVKAELQ